MDNQISEIWNTDIEKLIFEARNSDLRRSRINLHKSPEFGSQKMLIALFNDSKVGMHRHPMHKSETYVPLIGELVVEDINNDGTSVYITSGKIKIPFKETIKKSKVAFKEFPSSDKLTGNQLALAYIQLP